MLKGTSLSLEGFQRSWDQSLYPEAATTVIIKQKIGLDIAKDTVSNMSEFPSCLRSLYALYKE
jgi:hypothetical protein